MGWGSCSGGVGHFLPIPARRLLSYGAGVLRPHPGPFIDGPVRRAALDGP